MTAEDAVLDWMLAMYIGDASVGDGRYAYHNYTDAPKAEATETFVIARAIPSAAP